MRNDQGNTFTEQGGIWVLELKKFNADKIESEDQGWLKFFKEGDTLDDNILPDWMITKEMQQAMSTLTRFSEKELAYYRYQARQDYLRQQSTIQHELDSANKSAAELKAKAAELEARLNEAAIREVEANAREAEAIARESEANISKELALKEAQAASLEIERLKSLLSKNDQ